MAFASTDDIAARLQESSLSGTLLTSVELLLDLATAVIAEAAGKDDAWATELEADGVPTILRGLTIELVCRALASPQGLKSASEQLGAYQRQEVYSGDPALTLSEVEQEIVRRAVNGSTAGSSKVDSHITEIHDLTYGS